MPYQYYYKYKERRPLIVETSPYYTYITPKRSYTTSSSRRYAPSSPTYSNSITTTTIPRATPAPSLLQKWNIFNTTPSSPTSTSRTLRSASSYEYARQQEESSKYKSRNRQEYKTPEPRYVERRPERRKSVRWADEEFERLDRKLGRRPTSGSKRVHWGDEESLGEVKRVRTEEWKPLRRRFRW